MRTLAQWDELVEARATRLVRAHVRGRKPIADVRKRRALHHERDRLFDLLIAAVEGRDRARARIDRANMAQH